MILNRSFDTNLSPKMGENWFKILWIELIGIEWCRISQKNMKNNWIERGIESLSSSSFVPWNMSCNSSSLCNLIDWQIFLPLGKYMIWEHIATCKWVCIIYYYYILFVIFIIIYPSKAAKSKWRSISFSSIY